MFSFAALVAGTHTFAQTATADSLFRHKQYTESLAQYDTLFAHKKYSPAMLLKMAYIEEGLGKIGPTLYYLSLYARATHDAQAREKMEELASKFGLSGYETRDADRLRRWLDKSRGTLQAALAALLLAAAAGVVVQRRRHQTAWGWTLAVIVTAVALTYLTNAYRNDTVIIGTDQAYLMSGPSAGANVAARVGAGHQLPLLGQEDVWLKVRWMDKVAWVKRGAVLAWPQ